MPDTKSSLISLGDLTLRDGGRIPSAQLAYATWGTLNEDRSNAVLIFHALSGTHHVSGNHPEAPEACNLWTEELHDGWWNKMVGPGKAIDTNHFFVICANYLGGVLRLDRTIKHQPRNREDLWFNFPAP
ncbi:hypothetical protein OAF49_00765 [Akkermansiaceae bacterium]|nr:hypothetical protein [Akkermansiaceae bacterium]